MKRLGKGIFFFFFYAKEVVVANFQIAAQILGRRSRNPAFLTISVEELNDRQLLLVTNLITMTPGTLTVDLSPDNRVVLIHLLVPGDSSEKDRMRFESKYVRPIREIF